jgi:hypothetical protein
MHEDLRVAIGRALLLKPEDCRTFALQYAWSACTTQFLQNLEAAADTPARRAA